MIVLLVLRDEPLHDGHGLGHLVVSQVQHESVRGCHDGVLTIHNVLTWFHDGHSVDDVDLVGRDIGAGPVHGCSCKHHSHAQVQ